MSYENMSLSELECLKSELVSILEEQALNIAELNRAFVNNKVKLQQVLNVINLKEV